MAKTQLDLQKELKKFCNNVYFQPPESIKLNFPCIIYNREQPKVERADNVRYKKDTCYSLKYITTDPNTSVPDNIADYFTYCEINRYYIADNLTHVSLTLFY